MNQVIIKEVKTRKDRKAFVEFPKRLYADNPYYVPDLDRDIEDLLPRVIAYLAYDEEGNVVGRVATFVNKKANDKWNLRAARFSYLDFIDDEKVVNALMQAVEEFAIQQGMNQVQGPLGFFDFDKEGMLVEGFDRLGSMIEYYNAPYYAKHLERLGYGKEVDWVQTLIKIPAEVPKTYERVAKYVREEAHLHVRKLTNEEITKGGYGRRMFQLFNETYAHLFGFSEMPDKQIDDYINQYISLVDKDLMPIIEDEEGNMVGACVTMGSLSHAMRKTNGKLFPLGWWHLLKAIKWKHEETLTLMLIAVKTEFQGYGVNALFFDDMIPLLNKKGYKWAETGPMLETNLRVQSQWKPLNPENIKRRRCYSKKL